MTIRYPCTAATREGLPCRAWAVPGTSPPRCSVHGGGPEITEARRCTATCNDGTRCQGWAVRGTDPPRCGAHADETDYRPPSDRRCTALRRDGSRCRGWASRGSDPPRCGPHGGRKLPGAEGRRCTAACRDGTPCPSWAVPGTDPPRCGAHGPYTALEESGRRCTARRVDGTPCHGWAVRGTDPPRCGVHGGTDRPIGPPLGNQNRLTHGFYARVELPEGDPFDVVIQDLFRRYVRLSAYIDQLFHSDLPSIQEVIHLFRTYGQTATRLRKLLHQRRALAETVDPDGISPAIHKALDELSVELGTDL